MKITKKRYIDPFQLARYTSARQIEIELPEKLREQDLWPQYHLQFSPDDQSGGANAGYDFFYNDDLRSCCGIMGEEYDMHNLILFPRYYAKFNPEEFKRLLEEAESLRPEWGNSVSGAISRIDMPRLP